MDGQVFHYRDYHGLECDAVIRLNNGDFALVEVKLGGKAEEVAAEDLIKLESLLVSKSFAPPKFKMILTGGEDAYTRKDGVLVVPPGLFKTLRVGALRLLLLLLQRHLLRKRIYLVLETSHHLPSILNIFLLLRQCLSNNDYAIINRTTASASNAISPRQVFFIDSKSETLHTEENIAVMP